MWQSLIYTGLNLYNETLNSNTTHTQDNSYTYNNSHSYSNMYNNTMYNQVLTMTIIPIITTAFTSIFTSIVGDIKYIVVEFITRLYNNIIKKTIIEFNIKNNQETVVAILWYINHTKSISDGYVLNLNKIKNHDNNEENLDIILCPTNLKFSVILNENDKDKIKSNNDKENIDNNISKYYKINDKKYYYYYTKNDSISIISYNNNSIDNMTSYINDIINKYEKIKYENKKNKSIEHYITISLYDEHHHRFSSNQITMNRDIISLIWYLNNFNKIKNGKIIELNEKKKNSNDRNNNDKNNNDKNNIIETMMIPISTIINNKIKNIENIINNDNKENINKHEEYNKNDNNIIELFDHIFCELFEYSDKEYSYFFKISSLKYDTIEIIKKLNDIKNDYDDFMSKQAKKQLLYTFKNMVGVADKYSGEKNRINTFNITDIDSSQSFEHIFLDEKDQIIKDLNKLKNKDFYKNYGMKRKIIYLLYGKPGCGKTSLVTAIANYLLLSIKNIPISSIKTNNDLDFALNKINNGVQEINNNELITLFDEIDSINKSLIKSKEFINENDEIENEDENNIIEIKTEDNKTQHQVIKKNNKIEDDPLDIGYLLSKIDGNEDQDGNIIIATCNDISKFDFTLYRNGRFKLIELKYIGRNQITKMIEKYGNINLSEEQKLKIRDDRIIQTLNIKELVINYIYEKDNLIDFNDVNIIIDSINNLTQIE